MSYIAKISKILLATTAGGLFLVGAMAQAEDGRKGPRHDRDVFAEADTNGDGIISREEQAAMRDAAFARMDHDGDGYLTEQDRAAMQVQREEKRNEMRERARARGEQMREAREARQAEIDLNDDGVISREEFMAAENQKISRLDLNGDGNITKEEAEAARQERRAKWSERRNAD